MIPIVFNNAVVLAFVVPLQIHMSLLSLCYNMSPHKKSTQNQLLEFFLYLLCWKGNPVIRHNRTSNNPFAEETESIPVRNGYDSVHIGYVRLYKIAQLEKQILFLDCTYHTLASVLCLRKQNRSYFTDVKQYDNELYVFYVMF